MKSKNIQWCFAVLCGCGKINVIASAPSPNEQPVARLSAREVLCGCGKKAIYQTEDIRRIPQP